MSEIAYWKYKVVVKNNEYSIKEIYYDKDNSINSFIDKPAAAYGVNKRELKQDLEAMLKALQDDCIDQRELDCLTDKPANEDECVIEIEFDSGFDNEEI